MIPAVDAIFLHLLPRQIIEKTYDSLNRMTRVLMFRADGTVEDDQKRTAAT